MDGFYGYEQKERYSSSFWPGGLGRKKKFNKTKFVHLSSTLLHTKKNIIKFDNGYFITILPFYTLYFFSLEIIVLLLKIVYIEIFTCAIILPRANSYNIIYIWLFLETSWIYFGSIRFVSFDSIIIFLKKYVSIVK